MGRACLGFLFLFLLSVLSPCVVAGFVEFTVLQWNIWQEGTMAPCLRGRQVEPKRTQATRLWRGSLGGEGRALPPLVAYVPASA